MQDIQSLMAAPLQLGGDIVGFLGVDNPLMGQAATAADLAVATSDDPLSEDPDRIISQIVAGMDAQSSSVVVRMDRREAIREALLWAHPGDTVLVAGGTSRRRP